MILNIANISKSLGISMRLVIRLLSKPKLKLNSTIYVGDALLPLLSKKNGELACSRSFGNIMQPSNTNHTNRFFILFTTKFFLLQLKQSFKSYLIISN